MTPEERGQFIKMIEEINAAIQALDEKDIPCADSRMDNINLSIERMTRYLSESTEPSPVSIAVDPTDPDRILVTMSIRIINPSEPSNKEIKDEKYISGQRSKRRKVWRNSARPHVPKIY